MTPDFIGEHAKIHVGCDVHIGKPSIALIFQDFIYIKANFGYTEPLLERICKSKKLFRFNFMRVEKGNITTDQFAGMAKLSGTVENHRLLKMYV